MEKINFDFKNRTAVITGGAQGFGLDISKRFLDSGAKVIIWDIDPKMIEKAHKDLNNPNCVKVVSNDQSEAIKFFRNDVNHHNNIYHHIGIYGYSYKTLNEFVNLEPTSNELDLKLEQLRFLDNEYKIYVSKFDDHIQKGIDTIDDVKEARKFLEINEN